MTDPRSRLLLVAPLLPAPAGNGLAMRSGLCLDALATDHEVTLWVVPVAAGGAVTPTPWVAERAAAVVVAELTPDPLHALTRRLGDSSRGRAGGLSEGLPELAAFATAPAAARLREATGDPRWDVLVVLRSYLARFALPWLSRRDRAGPRRAVLDLDDDEAVTRRRLADLHRLRGRSEAAVEEEEQADRFAAFERETVGRFDRLLVCHEGHREALARRGASGVAVVPNAVDLPAPRRAPPAPGLRLLLVGNLSYLPNLDAAELLCDEIVPRLRRLVSEPVEVRVVGRRPPPGLVARARAAGVELFADVDDLEPFYRWASVALAPLRAGGGTRIKILEAMAHQVPVVSTHLGAEGLLVEPGHHLLLADDPEELAARCADLAANPSLAVRLAAAGRRLVADRYRRRDVVMQLREVVATTPPGGGS